MSRNRKWKPSKTAAREYAQKMDTIEAFCNENGISYSRTMDSYYFALNGQKYRVSNHTIKASNNKAYRLDEATGEMVQVRERYHTDDDGLICFTASKTRIPEIYAALKAGKALDKRGYVK